jgi:hypothetical protein
MVWTNPNTPNLADYVDFLTFTVGIDPAYLPPGSPFVGYALKRALKLVNNDPRADQEDYTIAVYNCAAHIQYEITPDVVINGAAFTFFRDARASYDLYKQSSGVVSASTDVSTSATFAVPNAIAQLMISDLDFMKTFWGRQFLAYQQNYGPTVWDLS